MLVMKELCIQKVDVKSLLPLDKLDFDEQTLK